MATTIDRDLDRAVHAQRTIDHRTRKRLPAILRVADGEQAAERIARADGVLDHDHPYTGLPRPEHVLGRCEGSRAQEIHEQVVLELLVRPRVVPQLGAPCALFVRHESGTAAPRAQSRSPDRVDPERHLVVEGDASAMLTVLVDPHAQRPVLVPLRMALLGTGGIECIAHRPRAGREIFDRQAGRLVDEPLCGHRPRPSGDGAVDAFDDRLSESAADRIVLRRGDVSVQKCPAKRIVPGRRGRGILSLMAGRRSGVFEE